VSTLVETADGLLYRKNTADEWIIRENHYTTLLANLRPGDRVLDAGGYIGSFAAACAVKNTFVTSYEPVPANFEILRVNARTFGFHGVHAALISDKVPLAPIQVPTVKFYANEAYPPHGRTLEKKGYTPIDVPAIRMSAAQEAVDPTVVKIDVEGTEIELLADLDLESIRMLFVEYELRRHPLFERAIEWDEHMVSLGYMRTGQPVSTFSRKSWTSHKTYIRS